MTPNLLRALVLRPVLAWLSGPVAAIHASPAAERLLVAIALQESGLRERAQRPVAHARGFWQFERAGVGGVLAHPSSRDMARRACEALRVAPAIEPVYLAVEHNDALACVLARLLLRTDPAAIPGTEDDAWACYLRCWRPGKPHRDRWSANWRAAA